MQGGRPYQPAAPMGVTDPSERQRMAAQATTTSYPHAHPTYPNQPPMPAAPPVQYGNYAPNYGAYGAPPQQAPGVFRPNAAGVDRLLSLTDSYEDPAFHDDHEHASVDRSLGYGSTPSMLNYGLASPPRGAAPAHQPQKIVLPQDIASLDDLFNRKTSRNTQLQPPQVALEPSQAVFGTTHNPLSPPAPQPTYEEQYGAQHSPAGMESHSDSIMKHSQGRARLRTRLCRLFACLVVLIVVIVSVIFLGPSRSSSDEDESSTDRGIIIDDNITSSPTMTPVVDTIEPTMAPTAVPTVATVPTLAPTPKTYEPYFAFVGDFGTRMGIGVAMTEDGSHLATLEGSGNIDVYGRSSGSWLPLESVPVEAHSSRVADLDMAIYQDAPVVAVASRTAVQVLRFTEEGNWTSHGQSQLEWLGADNETPTSAVRSPKVAISADGKTLVTAFLHDNGSAVVGRVYRYVENDQDDDGAWNMLGDPMIRTTGPFLAVAVAISADGKVVAIGDWRSASPSAIVETFDIQESGWVQRPGEAQLTWGPSAVSLSGDGGVLAVTTPTPGDSKVYLYDSDDGWSQVGDDMAGGASVAISSNGRQIAVGSTLLSSVQLYSLDTQNEVWSTTQSLQQTPGSQFGASVALAGDGGTLVVGAPLDDTEANNAGRVFLYD